MFLLLQEINYLETNF